MISAARKCNESDSRGAFFGYRFAPRLRDLKDRRLHLPPGMAIDPLLAPLADGASPLDVEHLSQHWDELLRVATSIRSGTITASAMLRKLSAYPRQNGLAVAVRKAGRLERSIFMLNWLRDVDLRRRSQGGLNKGEVRNALARAIFFCQLGELRDRTFENQTYRASGRLKLDRRGRDPLEHALPPPNGG